jgi:outer membrane putative beta-barrel porin/alpha-amylase
MRFLGSTGLIGLSLCVLGASTAWADQCPEKESPIATDRPDVTNSSLVVPQGSFQNENGINFSQRNGGHEFDGTDSRLRWGIAPCMEILVDIPTYFAAVSGPLNSGFTNVTPAIKWQISPLPGQLDLSLTVGAGLPTGTKTIAGPGVQPYVQFPWSWQLAGGWGISGMITNFILPADPTNKLSTETTFVLEREVAERVCLYRICWRLPRPWRT